MPPVVDLTADKAAPQHRVTGFPNGTAFVALTTLVFVTGGGGPGVMV
jgi:hypothetical protein